MGVSRVTVRTFFGGAGCGKTFSLMEALSALIVRTPLKDGQRVLALTFMHGSRRRLDERLDLVPGLLRRHECATVDSFAWRIVRRWRALADHLGFVGLVVDDHERISAAAATLLELDVVAKWVAATFPILLVDEAQDLSAVRLRIFAALARHLEVLAAADEFQCLDEQLRPNPTCLWLASAGVVDELTEPKRTSVNALLQAASAIRSGTTPVSNGPFKIQLTSNAALAGTWLANAIGWSGGGKSVAVITPTDGQFSRRVSEWVASNTTTKGFGPFQIRWEQSESRAVEEFFSRLVLPESSEIAQVTAAIHAIGNHRVTTDVLNWVRQQRKARGQHSFTRDEIAQAVKRSFADRRRGQREDGRGFRAMTVHGAKNREFENVIVLWPAAVGGSDDQKRRLLYNAVTRARQRCLVLVQAKNSLQAAPFI
ncbi:MULTISPECIES: ATP-dependent helicase [unclassified Caballeronia]|uniref:ATP-binding domain-containing protein n=1 Tax=unclassified Caballeronia TaxID=2646786 RepID=UPI00202876F1|nr:MULTISPECIES: ATP-dependent helicase [unclassified Caballeronia]